MQFVINAKEQQQIVLHVLKVQHSIMETVSLTVPLEWLLKMGCVPTAIHHAKPVPIPQPIALPVYQLRLNLIILAIPA